MIKNFELVSPESQGIKSEHILKFIQKIKDNKINLHSFMIVRNQSVVTEAYYKPFDKDFEHRLYSASKTIVSLAIGKMVGDHLIKLDDKLCKFFPDFPVDKERVWLKNTTVLDALKMSVPMLTDTYFDRKYKDWAWTFFNRQTDLKPAGAIFNYNTSGTFILDVIVERITGKTFLEYLRPVFDEIGVSQNIWCVKSPDGYSWGGSGVVATLRDFAKIGDLVMYKGNYNGKQLLPLDYMEKATSKQIANINENSYSQRTTCGYGYQIWISKHGYSLYGMGSQLVFCFPDKNLMFVCQGDTQSNVDKDGDKIYDYFIDTVYENLSEEKLTESEKFNELKRVCDNLELNTDFGDNHSEIEKEIENVTYDLNENPMGWKWFKFNFNDDEGLLTYENARGVKRIKFGLGKMVLGTFPETDYYDRQVDVSSNRELNSATCANFIMPNELMVRNYIIDTNFGNCFMVFGFKNNEVGIEFNKRAEFFMQDYVGFAGGQVRK